MSTTTLFELERQGAAEARTKNKLIEPLPRTIAHDVRWLLNKTTGYIEVNHPLMAALGDTVFVEYEPSKDELLRLKAGQRVLGAHEGAPRAIDLSAAPSMTGKGAEAQYRLKPDLFGGLKDDAPEPVRPVPKTTKLAKAQASLATDTAKMLVALSEDGGDDADLSLAQPLPSAYGFTLAPETPAAVEATPAPVTTRAASVNVFGASYKPAGKK